MEKQTGSAAPAPKARIFGVGIHDADVDEVLRFLRGRLEGGGRARVFNANAHLLNLAWSRPALRRAMGEAELVFCDGFGPKLAARLLSGARLPRLTPPDWIDDLVEACAVDGRSLFLLGGMPGIAEAAAEALSLRHPGAAFVGTHHGYFDKRPDSPENESVVACINAARPDVLVVCFGMPAQELWVTENWARLEVGAAVAAGALFDYVAGVVRRGPRWMTDHGLEWLARLAIEPMRLCGRYIVGLPVFFARVGMEAARHRRAAA